MDRFRVHQDGGEWLIGDGEMTGGAPAIVVARGIISRTNAEIMCAALNEKLSAITMDG